MPDSTEAASAFFVRPQVASRRLTSLDDAEHPDAPATCIVDTSNRQFLAIRQRRCGLMMLRLSMTASARLTILFVTCTGSALLLAEFAAAIGIPVRPVDAATCDCRSLAKEDRIRSCPRQWSAGPETK